MGNRVVSGKPASGRSAVPKHINQLIDIGEVRNQPSETQTEASRLTTSRQWKRPGGGERPVPFDHNISPDKAWLDWWTEEFRCVCEDMQAEGQTLLKLPFSGEVCFEPAIKCPCCETEGMYLGHELAFDFDFGTLFRRAEADFCPNCHGFHYGVLLDAFPANPHILKQYIVASHADYLDSLSESPVCCPNCGQRCFTYQTAFQTTVGYWDFRGEYTCTLCLDRNGQWEGDYEWNPNWQKNR